MRKRVLSVIMLLCMVLTLFPATALAADSGNTTNGYYDGDGVWQAGGTGSASYEAEDGTKLTLSKTAVDKGNNTFDITLGVTAVSSKEILPPGAAATVLVIDVSGSMDYCAKCKGESRHNSGCTYYKSGFMADNSVKSNQTRIYAAKAAAVNFLDSYKGTTEGSGRYVAVVKFSTLSTVVLNWVDVSTSSGYNAAKNAVNGLSADGGTNLQQGLVSANGLFSSTAISSVAKENYFTVALTDGAPTYYGKSGSGAAGGNGSSGSSTINSETAKAAATLRSNAKVYTVCFGVANDSTYSGGPKVGDFLRDSIASSGCAYNAEDADELYEVFKKISQSIEEETGSSGEGAMVLDPMGMFVKAYPGVFDEITENGYKWVLKQVDPVVSGGTYTYKYTLTYTVTLDADAEGFDESKTYPANGVTVLKWNDDEEFEFPVPGIKGQTSRYTVTYVKGDHGVLNGGDAQVKYENIKKWSPTVTAERPTPAVTADSGYYFVGWQPVIADKVTGNVTYVAQYAPQTEIVLIGDSNTVDYNGKLQSVTTFTVNGIDASAVSGVSYSAKGTDANTYKGSFSGTPVITVDGKNVTEQYKVTYKTGELVVNKLDVTLTSATDSKGYDGNPLTKEEVAVTKGAFVEGEGASYNSFASITDVGSVDNTFKYTLNEGTKAANYNIKTEYGKLTVSAVSDTIKIIANSKTQMYDGKVLTDGGFTVKGKLADGDKVEALVEGSRVDAGSAANKVVTYKIVNANGDDVTPNYANIVTVDGKLTVTKRDVVLTSGTDSKTYDGNPLTKEVVTAGGDGFAAGEGASYKDFASITNAGSVDNTFKYELKPGTKADNYNISVVPGTLTVTKIDTKILVTAESGNKMYDGDPLTN
ncbi:MAG: VWA domain-containing protein, partial [Oscillospiraceae bacterium]|nr:VWA domain-containing protein [Oscillospiraceae bacterium]